jgi:hypothetical protein
MAITMQKAVTNKAKATFPLRDCLAAAAKTQPTRRRETVSSQPFAVKKASPPSAINSAVNMKRFPASDSATSRALDGLCIISRTSALHNRTTPYASSAVPNISLRDYAAHLAKHLRHGDAASALGLALIQRYLTNGGHVCPLTEHRLLLCAVHMGQKAHYDDLAPNSYVARVGGISASELATLEMRFLTDMDYRVQLTEADVEAALESMSNEREVNRRQRVDDEWSADYIVSTSVDSELC